jgi:hypothetical protein
MRVAIRGSAPGLLLGAVLGCGVLGCGSGALGSPDGRQMACTLIGCEDEFTATVTVDSTMVPAGRHTFTMTIDGAASSCTFQLPPSGNLVNDPCSTGFGLSVGPAQTCTTTQTDAVSSQQCQPIDGVFVEKIIVNGSPNSMKVQQTVGGTVIFEQTISPTYQTNQPNGPGCGPTCHQASAAWTIP